MILWSPLGTQTLCIQQHSSRGYRSRMASWNSPSPPPYIWGRLHSILSGEITLYPDVKGVWVLRVLSFQRTQDTSQTMPYSSRSKIKSKFGCLLPIPPETDPSQNWETTKAFLWGISIPLKRLFLFPQYYLHFVYTIDEIFWVNGAFFFGIVPITSQLPNKKL